MRPPHCRHGRLSIWTPGVGAPGWRLRQSIGNDPEPGDRHDRQAAQRSGGYAGSGVRARMLQPVCGLCGRQLAAFCRRRARRHAAAAGHARLRRLHRPRATEPAAGDVNRKRAPRCTGCRSARRSGAKRSRRGARTPIHCGRATARRPGGQTSSAKRKRNPRRTVLKGGQPSRRITPLRRAADRGSARCRPDAPDPRR